MPQFIKVISFCICALLGTSASAITQTERAVLENIGKSWADIDTTTASYTLTTESGSTHGTMFIKRPHNVAFWQNRKEGEHGFTIAAQRLHVFDGQYGTNSYPLGPLRSLFGQRIELRTESVRRVTQNGDTYSVLAVDPNGRGSAWIHFQKDGTRYHFIGWDVSSSSVGQGSKLRVKDHKYGEHIPQSVFPFGR